MTRSYVLPIDKPAGPTSHDIVARARRSLATRRVGHTGTLDPFASGLLLLCVEAATRLAEFLTDLPKAYHAVARLDGATTTDDLTGEPIGGTDSWQTLSEAAVRSAFENQRGTRLQAPSQYSAKKIAGRRAYEIAREGEAAELAPVEVTIHALRVTRIALPEVEFEVTCSSGTYVRAIARDAGSELGTGGHLSKLRRTAIGRFEVARALTLDELSDSSLIQERRVDMVEAVRHLERMEVTEQEEQALRFGQAVRRAAPAGVVAVTHDARLVAIANSDGTVLRPRKVFPHD